jgi:hypothetical protein
MDKSYGYVAPVTRVEIEYFLAHCVRRACVFSAARAQLQRTHFEQQSEYMYGLLWQALCELTDRYGGLPNQELLGTHGIVLLKSEPTPGPEFETDLLGFVSWIWAAFPDDASFQDEAAFDALRRFLYERAVHDQLKQVLLGSEGRTLEDLTGLLRGMTQNLSQIDAIHNVESAELIPQEMETRDVRYLPTGVEVIDTRMDGGSKPGEVHVLLAPTGVGKTMTAVEIACSRAKAQQVAEANKAGSGRLSVLFSFEGDSDDEQVPLAARVMCYAAEIHKSRVEHMRNYDELSRTGNLLEYEQMRFRSSLVDGRPLPGEYERLMAARVWVNQFMHVADFSMSRRSGRQARGAGGVPEMRQYLDFIAHKYRREIGTVIIDWAGVCVLRKLQMEGHRDPNKAAPMELTNFVDLVHSEITTKYGCDAWVMHQLNGEANGRSVTSELHHSMALWCATFAIPAWFAFVLGNKDKTNNTCMLWATKTRRGEGKAGTLCFIDGAFGRLLPATNFTVDQQTGRVVTNEEVQRFGQQGTIMTPPPGPGLPAGF